MTTRKTFIANAAVAALVLGASPSPMPSPKPSPAPAKPSALAEELARSLQRDFPKAHLSDAVTSKIAADIQQTFAIGEAFRRRKNEDLPPPDFVFVASTTDRP